VIAGRARPRNDVPTSPTPAAAPVGPTLEPSTGPRRADAVGALLGPEPGPATGHPPNGSNGRNGSNGTDGPGTSATQDAVPRPPKVGSLGSHSG
jgi:hypothetical protein